MHADAGTHRPGRRSALWLAAVLLAAAGALAAGFALSPRQSLTAAVSTAPPATGGAADRVAQTLRLGRPTVVEFGSTSCVSCRERKPLLAQLAREQGDRVAVADIDVLKEREYLVAYRIMVMPTQVFYDAQGRETRAATSARCRWPTCRPGWGLADVEPVH